jgi:glycosyltransferase involved in cell wall biosynthesis
MKCRLENNCQALSLTLCLATIWRLFLHASMARFLIIAYSSYIRDSRVKRHAEALAARGDDVDVICLAGEQLRSANGVRLIGISMPRYRGSSRTAYIRSYVRFFAFAAIKAIRLNREKRYQAVITCSMPDAVVLCGLALKVQGTRVVLDVHDTMPELYRDKFGGRRGDIGAGLLMVEERISGWLADRVIAVHDLHRHRLESAGIPSVKIRTVLNSPDPRIFSSTTFSRTTNRHFELISHGTITRRLGLEVAFNALELLRNTIPELRLTVIGSGDHLANAKSLVEAMRLGDIVNFVAPVPIEELPALLREADVGVVPNPPSAATHLMLPVKMMEYAKLGIPIIAARLRTIEHYFGDGAACLFEAGNPRALAAAINELYSNPKRAAELASRACRVAEALSWTEQRERFFDAIDSLLLPAGGLDGGSVPGSSTASRDH